MVLFTLIISLFLFSAEVSAENCLERGMYKKLDDTKRIISASYCYIETSDLLVDKKSYLKGKTTAEGILKDLPKVEKEHTSFGNPSYHYCTQLKGTPLQTSFLLSDKKWKNFSICRFKDRSFVNLDYLYSTGSSVFK